MDTVLRLVLLGLLFQIGSCVRVVNPDNEDQKRFVLVVQPGSSVTMKCSEYLAQNENIGFNGVKWHKTQRQSEINDPTAGSEVTSLAAVSEKYIGRVTSTFDYQSASSPVSVHITIGAATQQDSGWYSCFARSDDDVSFIQYDVQVYEMPSRLVLTGRPTPEYNQTSGSNSLLFYSNQDGVLKCTAIKGYPAPTLRIHIDGESSPLTGYGDPETVLSLEGNEEGLQTIIADTSITVTDVRMRADQNGRNVICSATTPQSGTGNTQTPPEPAVLPITVLYPPKILDCSKEWTADIGDRNVNFGCTFEASPAPEVLWTALDRVPLDIYPDGKIVDTIYSAEVKATTLKTPGNMSVFQTDLTLASITNDNYHNYRLQLKNELGTVQREFLLEPKNRIIEQPVVRASGSIMTSSLTVLCILATMALTFTRQ